MPWSGPDFHYSIKVLKTIAENYIELYEEGLSFREGDVITNSFSIAEYHADFDQALSSLGKKWELKGLSFKDYRHYNKFQRIVVADILGVSDEELKRLRFRDIIELRKIAYGRMKLFLNGEVK